jgi:hypothetical protein
VSRALERQRNQVKGTLFEVIVNRLLIKAHYLPMKADNIHIRSTDGHVRGRGYWHDIDALGRFAYPLFYMYPIRLLAEVKCYESDVPLWAVRNFVGALKDISENYFVDDQINREQMLAYQRYTDCGSFFSASGFTLGAQKFALAQGVFLISYENNPILKNLIDSMYTLIKLIDIKRASERKADFRKWANDGLERQLHGVDLGTFVPVQMRSDFATEFGKLQKDIDSVQTSAIAMVIGEDPAVQYPVHVLSHQKIPEAVFAGTDEHLFRVYFTETPRGVFFDVRPRDAEETSLLFSLPKHIYSRYFSEGRMLEFKGAFINNIELPTTINGIRRILRLKLDREWVNRQQERSS